MLQRPMIYFVPACRATPALYQGRIVHRRSTIILYAPNHFLCRGPLRRYISRSRTGLGFFGTASLRRMMRPIQRFTYSRRFINLRAGYCFRACALQVASCCESNRSLVDVAARLGSEKNRTNANTANIDLTLMFSTAGILTQVVELVCFIGQAFASLKK